MQNAIKEFIVKHRIFLLIALFGAVFFMVFTTVRCHLLPHITVKFTDLRPFHRHINVYYKGYKIGKTCKIKPSDDYQSTLVKVIIYPKNLKLPSNTTAILKKEKHLRTKIDYLELVAPKEPADTYLQNNDVIEGTSTVDAESFFASLDKNSLENVKKEIEQTVKNLNGMIEALSGIFVTVQEILNENRANINTTLRNLSLSSANLRSTTASLHSALSEQRLNSTFSSLDSTTANFSSGTTNLQAITTNIEQLSQALNSAMPQVETAITETGCLMKNLNEITCGIKNKLKTRFGGLRIFFGKVIENDCPCKSACKKGCR